MKRLIFIGVTTLICVIGMELVLHGLCFVSADVNQALGGLFARGGYLRDPRLGVRPNPDHPEADARGYRNASALQTASIVALGDSQTEGQGASREMAWPQQLAAATGFPAYNMGFGGYGPVHGLILMDEALALKPKVIIFAMYLGNDLFDSYSMVYERKDELGMASKIPAVLQSIKDRNAAGTLEQQSAKAFYGYDHNALRKALSHYSMTYSLVRGLNNARLRLFAGVDEWESYRRTASTYAMNIVLESGELRTILTPEYRMNAVDLGDPRIAEGERVAWEAIRRMHELAARGKVQFLLVLIPTKELVFKEMVERGEAPAPIYREMVSQELEILEETKAYCDEHAIEWIDTLGDLRRPLVTQKNPYAASPDGHPNALGYTAISEAIARKLSPLGSP